MPNAKLSEHHSRLRLVADISALDQLISQLSYDAESAARVHAARELQRRMTMLLPVLSSLATIVESLQAAGGVPAPLAVQMQAVCDWIHTGASTDTRPVLASTPLHAGWDAALMTAAEDRLQQMLALWHDCVALCQRLGEKHIEGLWTPEFLRWEVGRARHYDHGMLLLSAVTVGLSIFSLGMLWILMGWSDGATAVVISAITSCFFAALDEPAPTTKSFFNWNVVCLLMALVLLFAALPMAHDFEMLVLIFAVPYVGIGLLVARPKSALFGMTLAVVTVSDMNIVSAYSADFQTFFNSGVAGVAGIAFTLAWTVVVRPYGTRAATRRLVRAGWSDISDNALGKHPESHTELRARMLDRIAQLGPRLAANASQVSSDGLNEVRVELTALALQREMEGMRTNEQHAVRRVLRSISAYYKARLDGSTDAPPAALRTRLTNAQQKVHSRVALAALVDMQLALFPPARLQPALGGA
jgi:uncharacterized membrane protein YccC